MASVPGINIPAPIAPYDTNDEYATHVDTYGKGGFRVCQTYADMQAIPDKRKTIGMRVRVVNDEIAAYNKEWELTNSGWIGTPYSEVQNNGVYDSAIIVANNNTLTIDVSVVSIFKITLTQPSTIINIIGGPIDEDKYKELTLHLIQGTGANTYTFGSNVEWSYGGQPQPSFELNAVDVVSMYRFGNSNYKAILKSGW